VDLVAAGKLPGHRHAGALTTIAWRRARTARRDPTPVGAADGFQVGYGPSTDTLHNGDGSDPCPWSQGCGAVVVTRHTHQHFLFLRNP
jgi:hypothetical protein